MDAPWETWRGIHTATARGLRGLPAGYALARLLAERRGARNLHSRPRFNEQIILEWADEYFKRTGRWPQPKSGPVRGAPGETWMRVDDALRGGGRGLKGGSSLARLLGRHRGHRNIADLPRLTLSRILQWVDAHHRRTGRWPNAQLGAVLDAPGETWAAIGRDLTVGCRGLPGGSTLAQLLAEHRGVRNRLRLPRLSIRQILAWADEHRRRTGRWPTPRSGPIPQSTGETWACIEAALWTARRGLADEFVRDQSRNGGSEPRSLAQLLAAYRGVRNPAAVPPLTERQILAWADDHHRRTKAWPKSNSGPIAAAPGETWTGVAVALHAGHRGLERGSSLARLLLQHRGVPIVNQPRPLTIPRILSWARAYRRRTGEWPQIISGVIAESPSETWSKVNGALEKGQRGLPDGSSLAKLLHERLGARHRKHPPPLTVEQILTWADAHHDRTGVWPTKKSGAIAAAPGETWALVNDALNKRQRGLRDSDAPTSLARLLLARRGVRNRMNLPRLTEAKVLKWADQHFARAGQWPRASSGPVLGASGETWRNVKTALYQGARGLPGGTSLARLLSAKRGVRNVQRLPPLRIPPILTWARRHRRRTGEWPRAKSGLIVGTSGETWAGVDSALFKGVRGLPPGSSLARLLQEHCGVRNEKNPGTLKVAQIMTWAQAHRQRTGRWPRHNSGEIPGTGGETWWSIDTALKNGIRGLRSGQSLARLLPPSRVPMV